MPSDPQISSDSRYELPIALSEKLVRGLLESAPDAMLLIDDAGRIILSNKQTARIFGHPRVALIGTPVEMLIPERFRANHPTHRAAYLKEPHIRAMGERLSLFGLRKDGTEFPVEVSLSPYVTDGRTFIITVVHDVTQRYELERRLVESEERFRDLFDNVHDMILSIDAQGRFTYVNRFWQRTLGYEASEIERLTIWDVIHPDEHTHVRELLRQSQAGEDFDRFETAFRTKDGRELAVEGSVGARFVAGKYESTRGIFRDVTERRRIIRELQKAREEAETAREVMREYATRDSLTGLWNRRMIGEFLDQEIARAARGDHAVITVLLDLDHFKQVNDVHGHLVGDEVLREVGRRLQSVVRSYDVVGRYGGEEFLAILTESVGGAALERGERFRSAISDSPIVTTAGPLAVTTSVGVAVHDQERPLNARGLLLAADQALYRAKNAGRNRVELAVK